MPLKYREGGQFPDITLSDHTGSPVSVNELLTRGPLILAFYRGPW